MYYENNENTFIARIMCVLPATLGFHPSEGNLELARRKLVYYL